MVDTKAVLTVVAVMVAVPVVLAFLKGSKKKGLHPKNYQKYKIIRKDNVTHNTRRFRCALQTPDTVLGLPVGKHMQIRGKAYPDYKEPVDQPYTPTSCDDDIGWFELVIKIYDDGKLTRYLDTLEVGDSIEAYGPKGRIHYDAPSHFSIHNIVKKRYDKYDTPKLNMICGGTGLTPMYQVIQEIIKSPNDKTQVKMIFGNVSEDDILCREEVEQFRKSPQVEIVFTLDKASPGWKEETGYVTADMIKKYCFPPGSDTATLLCGPPGLIKGCRGALKTLGHPKDRVWCF